MLLYCHLLSVFDFFVKQIFLYSLCYTLRLLFILFKSLLFPVTSHLSPVLCAWNIENVFLVHSGIAFTFSSSTYNFWNVLFFRMMGVRFPKVKRERDCEWARETVKHVCLLSEMLWRYRLISVCSLRNVDGTLEMFPLESSVKTSVYFSVVLHFSPVLYCGPVMDFRFVLLNFFTFMLVRARIHTEKMIEKCSFFYSNFK